MKGKTNDDFEFNSSEMSSEVGSQVAWVESCGDYSLVSVSAGQLLRENSITLDVRVAQNVIYSHDVTNLNSPACFGNRAAWVYTSGGQDHPSGYRNRFCWSRGMKKTKC